MRCSGRCLMTTLAVLAAMVAVMVARPRFTLPRRLGGLAEHRTMALHGHNHSVVIHGASRTLPLMLYLHGGPGASEMPYRSFTCDQLEQHFLVVHWDQRGAASSCHPPPAVETLTVAQHVADTVALVEALLAEFGQRKVVLVGGSWGSMLALLVAQARPDLLHVVVARGLFAHGLQNEERSLDFVRTRLKELGRTDGLQALASFSTPYMKAGEDPVAAIDRLLVQRKWLRVSGGFAYACRYSQRGCSDMVFMAKAAWSLLSTPEFTVTDALGLLPCMKRTLAAMWPELEQWNAAAQVPRLDVPVLFMHGRHDHNTPASLVGDYVAQLEAPSKRLLWFEHSGHSPHKEQPREFQERLLGALRELQIVE